MYNFISQLPGLFDYLLLSIVLAVPLVALHEIGHGVVAKWLGAQDVTVHLGGRGPQVRGGAAGIGARGWRRSCVPGGSTAS